MGSVGSAIGGTIGSITGGLAQGIGEGAGIHDINPGNPGVNPDQAQQQFAEQNQIFKQQQDFINAINAQGGLQNQSQVFAQQQALANQLQQNALGQGPNPALAQLAQATGQNTANQAALMAGQRGAGANVGLIARQAAMQGGNIQQQAAGQAATLQAQQQLAAQQQLSAQQQAMQQVAANQVGNYGQNLNAYSQGNQGVYGTQLAALNNFNQASLNAQQSNNQMKSKLLGGVVNGISTLGGLSGGSGEGSPAGKYMGGMVDGYDQGGQVPQQPVHIDKEKAKQVQDSFNKALGFNEGGMSGHHVRQYFGLPMKGGGQVPGHAQVAGDSPKNDTVPAVLSPQEIVIPREIVMHANAPELAAKFVADILAKKGKK